RTANPCSVPYGPRPRSIPFQRSLFPFVDEADDEQGEENAHRGEAEQPDRVERDGPREEKRDLEIEDDEENRDEVVTYVEAVARVLERFEAALVRGELLRILPAAAKREPDEDQHHAEHARHGEEDQDREVVCKHTFVLRRPVTADGDKKIGR